jgi:cytoskeletal protein CcmA (bactofilin family)
MFEQSGKPQPAPAPGVGTATAFLGKGAKIVGKISFDGPAQIEGDVEGEITSRDTLTVGRTASLKATIKGATVIVHGQVTGDIEATTRIELAAPSRVDGDVTTPTLVVQEGAVLNGRCTMGAAAKAGTTIGVQSVSIGHPAPESAEKQPAKAR